MKVGDLEFCRIEKEPTIQSFIEAAKSKYGLELTGPT
jgi:hypothetical protein